MDADNAVTDVLTVLRQGFNLNIKCNADIPSEAIIMLTLSYELEVVPSSDIPVVSTVASLSPICSQRPLCHPPQLCICIMCWPLSLSG